MVNQEKLMIYLHNQDLTRPSWAVIDEKGQVRESAQHDEAQVLTTIAENKLVLVFVPAEDVLLLTAKLPKINTKRLAQALPYALEEQLIENVEDLHFAMGDADGTAIPVAIVAKKKISGWIELLKTWKIQPDKLFSTTHALAYEEKNWYLHIDHICIARMGQYMGFACDHENLPTLLQMSIANAENPPENIFVNNYTKQSFASAISFPIQENFIPQEKWLKNLASQISFQSINLLQGEFSSKKVRRVSFTKIWKYISYLGMVWLIMLFLYPAISFLLLHHRVSEIDEQIKTIYQRNFPQSQAVIAPKLRMEEKLQKIKVSNNNQLLLILADLAKIFANVNVKLNRFDYQNNQLNLSVTAASSEDLAALTNSLTQQGLSVKQQNANLNGTKINATLLVE